MKTTAWYKVKTIDYYGEWEVPCILSDKEQGYRNHKKWPDEIKLKENQFIEIMWPDKIITEGKLHICNGTGSAQIDMNNHPDHFNTQNSR